jgi:hypothetical protein
MVSNFIMHFLFFYKGFIPMSELTIQMNDEEKVFSEFRLKVRMSELLSASVLKLLRAIRFSGRLTIIFQNGKVLKSGYEEGYFRAFGPSVSSAIQ